MKKKEDNFKFELDKMNKKIKNLENTNKLISKEIKSVYREIGNIISKDNREKVIHLYSYLLNLKDKFPNGENLTNFIYSKKKEDINKDVKEYIFISSDMIEFLHKIGKLNSNEMKSILNEFSEIYLDIKYPSPQFDSIYNDVVNMKNSVQGKVKMSVTCIGVSETKEKFSNDKEINYLRLESIIDDNKNDDKISFQNCSSLTNVEISSSVTSIGSCAFKDCSSLTNIEIPSSVTSIGDNAFISCKSLKYIEIPSSVTSINLFAFAICESLTSIKLSSSLETIDSLVFVHCRSLESIEIPSSVKSIGMSAFDGCKSLKNVKIPSSVTYISPGAFNNCSSLTSISIPTSVKSIGSNTFKGCTSLSRVEIPSSIYSDELGIVPNVYIRKI